jgi:hypothetical protein
MKKCDHEWGESPEDALPFVMAFMIVILLCTRCCGIWDHTSHEDEPEVTNITEEVTTAYVTVDTCSGRISNR